MWGTGKDTTLGDIVFMKRFEALWYTDKELTNYETKEFSTREALLNFYRKHKNEPDRYDWWLTKRNAYWEVVEDIEF